MSLKHTYDAVEYKCSTYITILLYVCLEFIEKHIGFLKNAQQLSKYNQRRESVSPSPPPEKLTNSWRKNFWHRSKQSYPLMKSPKMYRPFRLGDSHPRYTYPPVTDFPT